MYDGKPVSLGLWDTGGQVAPSCSLTAFVSCFYKQIKQQMHTSDIYTALDSGDIAALALLDLSAAFDTVDHRILLQRLQKSFGLSSSALSCTHVVSEPTPTVRVSPRRPL